MIEKIRQYLQSVPFTFESWLASVLGIVLLRTFFEQYSSLQTGRFALIDLPTIIHYSIFYITAVFTIMIVVFLFSNEEKKVVFSVVTLGLPIILLPPMIDLLTAGVGGRYISYLFVSGQELLIRFFTFWGGHINNGITLGIQIEIFLGMIFCFTFVYCSKKNIWRAVGAGIAFYVVIFIFVSIPSILALIGPEGNNTSNTVVQQIFSSRVVLNNLHPSFGASELALFDLGFNKIMTGIFTIIATLVTAAFFFLSTKEKFIAVIKNSRPERIFFFFLLFILGTALANKTVWFANWIDIMNYFLMFGAFKFAWIFSVCQNDIHDERIDSISNPNRPLISGVLSRENLMLVSKISLFFSFLYAYSANRYALFFVTIYTLVYFLYSNPPFRLKRFVIINSFLVGLACLSVIMAGFFAISADKSILAFPPTLVLALIIIFTVVTNIRDIKDIDGDRADGIKTLPVLLGLKKSKMLIAGTICFFFLLIPNYFNIKYLFIPSLIASILSWYFITQENYKEWKGFAVYMLYLILLISALMSK
jgi:4-hydroxybenzoate polyprenyltransferase